MTRSPKVLLPVGAAVLAGLLVLGLILRTDRGDGNAAQVKVPLSAPLPTDLVTAAESTGIPLRAVEAYVGAARRVAVDDPTCRLAWNTLAGIGAAESSHGAFGGARLSRSGVARPPIVGVPLDGTGGNRAIRDTDRGALDDDTTWDRAVGPLQFIPTTWARWGADGDGDGRANPQDLDDAALAAGRYLCHAGGDLSTSAGWSRAVLTYNQSVPYASKVARTASSYATQVARKATSSAG